MRVVVAPDSFGGSLSAVEAARAIAAGWASVRPGDDCVLVPMADGGEGTVDAVAFSVPQTRRRTTEVRDALGRPVRADWLSLPDGSALVESAQACGLFRLAPAERDPLRATSFGAGELLLAAAGAGHDRILVGLGGSATVDGGAGLMEALAGTELRAGVIAAADVTAPLLGPTGAVATFAPQKGAAPADLPVLERRLRDLADQVERAGGSWRALPGAGAAGGLGFGLAAACGARIEPGAPLVAGLVGLEEALNGAELVITGEGALDRQTETGKAPGHVATVARPRGIPVFALAGRVEDGAGRRFDRVAELGPDGLTWPAERLAEAAATLARLV